VPANGPAAEGTSIAHSTSQPWAPRSAGATTSANPATPRSVARRARGPRVGGARTVADRRATDRGDTDASAIAAGETTIAFPTNPRRRTRGAPATPRSVYARTVAVKGPGRERPRTSIATAPAAPSGISGGRPRATTQPQPVSSARTLKDPVPVRDHRTSSRRVCDASTTPRSKSAGSNRKPASAGSGGSSSGAEGAGVAGGARPGGPAGRVGPWTTGAGPGAASGRNEAGRATAARDRRRATEAARMSRRRRMPPIRTARMSRSVRAS
jgi:hypothetical protein